MGFTSGSTAPEGYPDNTDDGLSPADQQAEQTSRGSLPDRASSGPWHSADLRTLGAQRFSGGSQSGQAVT